MLIIFIPAVPHLCSTPFSAGFITANARVTPHVDEKDLHGCVIVWSHDTDEDMGGCFYLPDLWMHFVPRELTVLRLASHEWVHGSEAPTDTAEGKTRYGMALVNKVGTINMAERQAADPTLPPPGLPLSDKRQMELVFAATGKKPRQQ